MNVNDVTQGSPEWLTLRAGRLCASEAAAMLGLSDKLTRTELLRMKAIGDQQEFSDWVQKNILDHGHEVEELARGHAEMFIGDDLYPITATADIEGLPLLASYDGLVMDYDKGFENKQPNKALIAYITENGDLPDTHWPQVEQQLLIMPSGKILFTVSDGTEENPLRLWYESKPERRAQLIAGWKQFVQDLNNYQHVEVIPASIAAPIKDLPALDIQITGNIVASNFVIWRDIVLERINTINTDLQTDQHFADAAKMVTFLDDGEKRIELVKQQAQSQASSIDEVFRALDDIKAEMRTKRLELNRLVEARKETLRAEILQGGKEALAAHIMALNTRLGKPYMPIIVADFASAMKGKKTIDSLRNAVDTTLAKAKIEANTAADRIDANLKTLRELATNHAFLFADTAQLVLMANDHLTLLVNSRIAEHKAAEEKKEAELRAKVVAEETARIEREQAVLAEAATKKIEQDCINAAIVEVAVPAVTQTTETTISPAKPDTTADIGNPTTVGNVSTLRAIGQRSTDDELRADINERLATMNRQQLNQVLMYCKDHVQAAA